MAETGTFQGVPPALFSHDWGVLFCHHWRQTENDSEYAMLGTVTFILCEATSSISSLSLRWDHEGYPAVAESGNEFPRFIADRRGWFRFIGEDISPFAAVVSKLIRFEGPVSFAISNVQKFEKVRNIARLTQQRCSTGRL